MGLCFLFFKRKTAYDIRISDWISDVCSSDLAISLALAMADAAIAIVDDPALRRQEAGLVALPERGIEHQAVRGSGAGAAGRESKGEGGQDRPPFKSHDAVRHARPGCAKSGCRSEEHTSELQSLMRISYAVFC